MAGQLRVHVQEGIWCVLVVLQVSVFAVVEGLRGCRGGGRLCGERKPVREAHRVAGKGGGEGSVRNMKKLAAEKEWLLAQCCGS